MSLTQIIQKSTRTVSFAFLFFLFITTAGCEQQPTPATQDDTDSAYQREREVEHKKQVEDYIHYINAHTLEENEYRTLERDVNGDGRKEKITLEVYPNNDDQLSELKTILTVNSTHIQVPGDNPQGFFGIIDLDTTDKILEIAVSDLGPSTDYTTSFYTFDGSSIVHIGTIGDLYKNMTFDGKGHLTTQTRAPILDTWFYEDEYALSKDHQLINVPKELYVRNMPPVTVLQTLPLLKSPSEDAPITYTLQKGDVVHIVGCDNIAWCVVENKSGSRGWFRQDSWGQQNDLQTKKRITHTEYFEGLSNAD